MPDELRYAFIYKERIDSGVIVDWRNGGAKTPGQEDAVQKYKGFRKSLAAGPARTPTSPG